jgi:hypothetical protein
MPKKIAIAFAALVLVLAITAWFVLPAFIARAAIDEAQRRGVTLTIGHVGVGFGAVTFTKLSATDPQAPGVRIDVADATLSLDGLSPRELVLHEPIVTMDRGQASLAALVGMRDRWTKPPPSPSGAAPAAGSSSTLTRIVVDGGVATLSGLAPAGTRVVVRAMTGELTRDPAAGPAALAGSAIALRGELALFADDRPVAGPWRLTLRRAAGADEQDLDLAPGAPGTAIVRRDAAPGGGSHVQVKIQKRRLDELAMPAVPFAPRSSTLDVAIDHEATPTTVRGHAAIELGSFTMPGAPAAAPLRANLAYDGTPAAARIGQGSFVFGPFQGALGGTIDVASMPPKAHIELTSNPSPCAALAQTLAEQALPGVGAALGQTPLPP